MVRNLILSGGIGHPFADAAQALADLLCEIDVASEITEDIEGGLASLAGGEFRLLTVYALRWRMLTGDKYAPHREKWAFSLSQNGRRNLAEFVTRGGGLLALHTAAICFDDWPQWKDLLGGAWVWGRSAHLPLGPIRFSARPASNFITAGVETFALRDEVYGNLDLTPDVEPLLVGSDSGGTWPVLWTRQAGAGRVVTDLLGHDRATIEQAVHRRILTRSVQWLLMPEGQTSS